VIGSRVMLDMPAQGGGGSQHLLPWQIRLLLREVLRARGDLFWSRLAERKHIDVYHETGMFPYRHACDLPTVLTIYDLSLAHYPQHHPRDRVRFFERHFVSRLVEVDHILTISDFIRQELIQQFGVDSGRVSTVPLAADRVFFPRQASEVATYLAGRQIPKSYFLYVGTLEPRKNLPHLMRALAQSRTKLPLVCAGAEGWMSGDLAPLIRRLGLSDRVQFLGHLGDRELALLYSGATAFFYPSLYEGFGLPVLEAMACGCPVVCSNQSSLPEVAGDAAVLLSPGDQRGWALALEGVIQDPEQRKELSRRGLERAQQFSWQSTAEQTVKLFREVISR